MKFSPRSLALAVALASQGAWAADTYLNVFYQSNPLQGVEVKLDGQDLGKTDRLGSAMGDTPAGTHTLEILRDGVLVTTVNFETAEDEDAEISISYEEEDAEPKVTVQKYNSADKSVTGFVGGVVTAPDGSQLAGAEVAIADTAITATTDANGVYRIELPRGSYDVSIKHPDYAASYVDGVRVVADLGVAVSAKLKNKVVLDQGAAPTLAAPAGTMEEVITLGVWNPQETTIDMERFSTAVTDSIDVTQLARFGDSSAAGALTRIVGVSVSEGKYANVRGLDGRYISSTLGGLLMPSTDPLRRDVQLDLFPANILGGIEIQKSYSADLLGTTTGGSVKMSTRGLPDERVNKLSISGAYNFEVTGDEFFTYENSNGDIFGYDSGLRDLPTGVVSATNGARSLTICDPAIDPVRCTAPETAAGYAVQFQDDYNPERGSAAPDYGISYAYGDRYSLENGEFGFYAAGGYKTGSKARVDAEHSDPTGDNGTYTRSQQNVSVSGYVVAGYEYNDTDEIISRTTVLRNTDNTTRIEDVIDSEDIAITEVIFEWVERQFVSQQFSGSHAIEVGEGHTLDWVAGWAQTKREEPDRRTYQYRNNILSTSTFERRWSDLTEDSTDFSIDYTIPLMISDYVTTEIKLGALYSDRSRDVDLYRFSISPGDNAVDGQFSRDNDLEDTLAYYNFVLDKVRLSTTTTDTDSYTSGEETTAFYATAETNIGDDWTVVVGVRQEDFKQELDYPNDALRDSFCGDPSNQVGQADRFEAECVALDESNVLPALALTYRFSDELQLRLGLSQTVSYPGLIERAESLVYDPETDDPIFGNPALKISEIENFDARLEYYFSDTESVTLAYFIKEIDNPIERSVPDGSGSSSDGITFRNAQSAELTGIELDINKNLIDADEYLLFASGNISYIDSEVELDEDSIRLEGEDSIGRELQGQSPWLANLQLGLDLHETEQKLTLLVNWFDDRIFRVTRGANNGPEYYNGRILVDFNYENLIGDAMTFKASLKNILNEDVEYERNGTIIESYNEGTSVNFSLSYEF